MGRPPYSLAVIGAGIGGLAAAAALRRVGVEVRVYEQAGAFIQLTNRQNTWMRFKTESDWVYGYDAWTVLLAPEAADAVSI